MDTTEVKINEPTVTIAGQDFTGMGYEIELTLTQARELKGRLIDTLPMHSTPPYTS